MVVVFLMQFCTPYFSSTFSLHLSSHLLYSKLVIPCQECIHPLATQPHVEFFFSSFFWKNLQLLNFFLLHIYSHFIKFIIPTHFWQFYAPKFAFHFQNSHQKAVAFDNIKMRNNENWLNVYSFWNTLSVILEWQMMFNRTFLFSPCYVDVHLSSERHSNDIYLLIHFLVTWNTGYRTCTC